ncbi:carbohydrate kinase family protein [Kitasatospora sp. NBC_01287]|uniref:carbohydrate kinase family protein n=1 Tax=Kitasatospora sp. NBC_01287 TaxID=2903573 RepID=UPI002254D212|nr:carbohydrate kinase family protein [Kitasatospora sp. NBC_01287]MCX4745533.1 carbohydrate kinase family protein [Kitasatospora sp. NBC_01287]
MTAAVDLACFSYLAGARLLSVDRYPTADSGAEVHDVIHSLAGDGPIAAVTAAGLALACSVVANCVGADLVGTGLLEQLENAGIQHRITQRIGLRTPEITVITDRDGTRTWFAHLAQATGDLLTADFSGLARARAAYIDCYRAITQPAAHAIQAAAQAGVPVILNLGSEPLDPVIRQAASAADVIAVQTGLPERHANQAHAVADDLFQQLNPTAALVTLGRLGVVARSATGRYRVPAGAGPVVHTHGAGAAFSGGFAAAYLAGHDLPTCLRRACTTATAHCATHHPYSPQGAHP